MYVIGPTKRQRSTYLGLSQIELVMELRSMTMVQDLSTLRSPADALWLTCISAQGKQYTLIANHDP
jgi:hypothetical protein